MIEIRPSTAAEIPAQKALWQTCFGDDDAFIDMFYRRYCKPEDVIVLLEDGQLRSMAAILPLDIQFPDGVTGKAGYIYALCTHPHSRSQGFIRELIGYLHFYLKKQGMDCVTLVPAEASLHRFFGMLGFDECFSHRKSVLERAELPQPGEGDTMESAEPEVYNRIRERLLDGQFHLSYSDKLISFQRDFSRMFGGDLYRFMVNGEEGCAVAELIRPDRVLVKELLAPPKHAERAIALLARIIPASYYYLRTPSFGESMPGSYIQSFAMVKWYDPRLGRIWARERHGYLGFGFD